MGAEKVSDLTPTMNRPAIPEQVDRSAEMAQEVMEEGSDIETGEIMRPTAEV